MLSVYEPPTLSHASVHANVYSVVHLIELLHGQAVVSGEVWTGEDQLASGVVAHVTSHSLEQRHDVPAHIFLPHVEPQASVWLVQGEINKALDGQVNALARLVPVAIEDDEHIFWNAKSLSTLAFLDGEKLGEVGTMSHHVNRLVVANLLDLLLCELRVGDQRIPLIDAIQKLREEAVGVDGCVGDPLEAELRLQLCHCIEKVDGHPDVVYDKDDVGLDRRHQFCNAMRAKGIVTVGHGRIHLAMLLHLVRVAHPVDGQSMHFVLLCQCWNQILGNAAKAGLYANVACKEDFCHLEW